MAKWMNVGEIVYPVGAIYTSSTSTPSPADLFGGTWVALTSNVSGEYKWKRTN